MMKHCQASNHALLDGFDDMSYIEISAGHRPKLTASTFNESNHSQKGTVNIDSILIIDNNCDFNEWQHLEEYQPSHAICT